MSDGDWEAFGERCGSALAQVIRRRPEPFKALWGHGDDVSITTQLNGEPFVKWTGPIASLDRQSEPMLDVPHYLGFFTFDAQVAFHRLELTSHSGRLTPDAD